MIDYQVLPAIQKTLSSKTLLLLHSGGMTRDEWLPQIPFWQKEFNLLLIDLPGHGKSLLHNAPTPSLKTIADNIANILLQNGFGPVHTLGSSLGGAIALQLAVDHTQCIDHLILYRVNYHKTSAGFAETLKLADPKHWQQYGLEAWLSKIHAPQGGTAAWKQVIARVPQYLAPQVTVPQLGLTDLGNIHNKTLLICGDRDPLVPIADLLEMRQVIQDCGLWIMPYSSHITASNTWRAEIFAKEVSRFLGV